MDNRIKELRKAKGITQQELSEKSGVSRPYISALENSQNETTKVCTMQKIADALQEDIARVFLLNK